MSNEATSAEQPQQTPLWSVADYERALADLEKLQEKLDRLRPAIPSQVAPLLQKDTSRAQMFADVRKAAVQSKSRLDDFHNDWNSEQTQQLLARSNESYLKDRDLGKANREPKYGWVAKQEAAL